MSNGSDVSHQQLIETDFYMAIRAGVAKGYSPIPKRMWSPQIGNVLQTLWDNPGIDYTFLTGPTEIFVSSDSVDDTILGDGAQKITLKVLNDYVQDEITIELDGPTPVSIGSIYHRVNETRVSKTGSIRKNKGKIYIYTGTATDGVPDDPKKLLSIISVDDDLLIGGHVRSMVGAFTVPAGQIWIVEHEHTNAHVTDNNPVRTVDTTIYSMATNTALDINAVIEMLDKKKYKGALNFQRFISAIAAFPEKTDFWIKAKVDTDEDVAELTINLAIFQITTSDVNLQQPVETSL